MPTKKLYLISLLSLLACAGAAFAGFWVFGKMNVALGVGFLVGAVAAGAGHTLFFKAWHSAPNGSKNVALYYGARVAIIFLTVIITLLISRQAALGAIIPQLFAVPVLAVTAVFSKE
jgi:hypothetical protein